MSQQLVCETKVDPANGATGRHHRVPERAKRMTAVTGFSLEPHGITVADVCRNLPPPALYEEAIRHDPRHLDRRQRRVVAYSGEKTGRSPKDKRIVRRPASEGDVWWGPVNVPLEPQELRDQSGAGQGLSRHPLRLYCVDGFAGWDPEHRVRVRVICERPYHALFMQNMLIRPTREELTSFGTPDYVIYNAGRFPANRLTAGMTSKTSVDLSIEDGEVVILGTEYAGEMKKAVFTITNYLMPKRGVLSMHCSATADRRLGAILRPVRPFRNGQDYPVGRPEAPAHRRRRALLVQLGRLQHRGRVLCQDDRPGPGGPARHLPVSALRRRAGECRPRRGRPPRQL